MTTERTYFLLRDLIFCDGVKKDAIKKWRSRGVPPWARARVLEMAIAQEFTADPSIFAAEKFSDLIERHGLMPDQDAAA